MHYTLLAGAGDGREPPILPPLVFSGERAPLPHLIETVSQSNQALPLVGCEDLAHGQKHFETFVFEHVTGLLESGEGLADRIRVKPVLVDLLFESQLGSFDRSVEVDHAMCMLVDEVAERQSKADHAEVVQQLNNAFRLLMREPQPELIALGMTRYWRGQDGLLLDVAPFVSALENAAACKALVFGKPAAVFFEAALTRMQRSAEQVFMIGDDIWADTDAAQLCGIRAIQVRTGKFRETDLNGTIRPFAVLDSIADLPLWWTQQRSSA